MPTYKETHSLEYRRKHMEKCKELHPTKIPVIIEPGKEETLYFTVGYSVPRNWTMVNLATIFRNKFQIKQSVLLFFLVGGEYIPGTSSTVGQLHEQYKDEDGFLYVKYYAVTSDNLF